MELLKEDETHWGRCILRCGSAMLTDSRRIHRSQKRIAHEP